MSWYKTSQYQTKFGKEIEFQAIPFSENNDKRGWVVHTIKAYVDGEEAGYINLSYIPKEKWNSIFNNNVWKFRRLALGHYDIPEDLVERNNDQEIEKYYEDNYYSYYNVDDSKMAAKFHAENEKEKATRHYELPKH